MPTFAETISNVTVSLGRDALLACVVDNLKRYQVITFIDKIITSLLTSLFLFLNKHLIILIIEN